MPTKAKTKRNNYVSYLKGYAIISIMTIHVLDWSNRILTANQLYFKELLYPSVMFFIAASGSLICLAYGKYDILTAAKKSFLRGAELIAVYFLYNIVKLYVYDFAAEPFYQGFIAAGKLNLMDILTLKSFTSPISIILTIGVFLIISPVFLWLAKRNFAKTIFACLIAALAAVNYFAILPGNAVTDFLYAKNNITFPLALWLLPFLIGFYLSMWGLERRKGIMLLIFAALAAVSAWPLWAEGASLKLTYYMYPLKLYYVFMSFAFMYFIFYIFYFLEKTRLAAVNFFLSLIRVLGDTTLAVYIYHWLVIDLTLWLFYPRYDYVIYAIPLFIIIYLAAKRRKLVEYYRSY